MANILPLKSKLDDDLNLLTYRHYIGGLIMYCTLWRCLLNLTLSTAETRLLPRYTPPPGDDDELGFHSFFDR